MESLDPDVVEELKTVKDFYCTKTCDQIREFETDLNAFYSDPKRNRGPYPIEVMAVSEKIFKTIVALLDGVKDWNYPYKFAISSIPEIGLGSVLFRCQGLLYCSDPVLEKTRRVVIYEPKRFVTVSVELLNPKKREGDVDILVARLTRRARNSVLPHQR